MEESYFIIYQDKVYIVKTLQQCERKKSILLNVSNNVKTAVICQHHNVQYEFSPASKQHQTSRRKYIKLHTLHALTEEKLLKKSKKTRISNTENQYFDKHFSLF